MDHREVDGAVLCLHDSPHPCPLGIQLTEPALVQFTEGRVLAFAAYFGFQGRLERSPCRSARTLNTRLFKTNLLTCTSHFDIRGRNPYRSAHALNTKSATKRYFQSKFTQIHAISLLAGAAGPLRQCARHRHRRRQRRALRAEARSAYPNARARARSRNHTSAGPSSTRLTKSASPWRRTASPLRPPGGATHAADGHSGSCTCRPPAGHPRLRRTRPAWRHAAGVHRPA